MFAFHFSVCFYLLVVTQSWLSVAGKSSRGKEFIISFMDIHVDGRNPHDVELIITTESLTPVTVRVTIPLYDPSWARTVLATRSAAKTVTIPHEIRGRHTEKSGKGVYVTADKEITVVGVNKELQSTGTFLGLPVHALGQTYYALTYDRNSELMVVGTQQNTAISITLPTEESSQNLSVVFQGTPYGPGETMLVLLDRFQTLHVYQDGAAVDLTGTHIKADKPIAVFSGNRHVAVDSGSADHLVEMMMPEYTWGYRFPTSSTPDRFGVDLYTLLASENDTTLSESSGPGNAQLNAGEYLKTKKSSAILTQLMASKPIVASVIATNMGPIGPNGGDPSMFSLVPRVQYCSNYTWSTVQQANGSDFNNTVTVMIETRHINGLRLDGQVPHWKQIKNDTTSGMSELWTYITRGTHHLIHLNKSVRFLVIVSGRVVNNSYAYVATVKMVDKDSKCVRTSMRPGDNIDNDCDGLIDEELPNDIDDDGDGKIDEDLAIVMENTTYRCEICRDPHAHTFTGQTYSVPVPCAYVVTRLQLKNRVTTLGLRFFDKIHVEVIAGNDKEDIKGRYFVSDVSVKIALMSGRVSGPSIECRTNKALIESGKIWNVSLPGNSLGRLRLGYNATENLAELWLSHSSLRVQFRPANRSQGFDQELKPGVFVQVGSMDLIYDDSIKFPNTMCSTINDSTSIKEYAQLLRVAEKSIGLYAAMEQNQANIVSGFQSALCHDVMKTYQTCSDKAYVSNTCVSLTGHPHTVRCMNERLNSTDVMGAVNDCVDYRCGGDVTACQDLLGYNETCPHVASIVDIVRC